ncbi:MAG: carboxymuconolactone decarboxylase family protein [Alphaproteobacteria bacterium]|nr:carboxymuconolactone decarboxylase family protein [Alphaproteobacteria bacterium]
MARFKYLSKEDLAPQNLDLLARDIALNRILAHSPGAARAFQGLGGYIRHRSTLDGRLRELAILQVGYLARSPYEYSHHVKIGMEFGVSESDIRAMVDETEGRGSSLEPLAKTVLRGAREMTRDLAMSDATFAELRQHLSEAHLLDLVLTIAFYNAVVRVLATMQIDVEPEYRKYLEQFPLPVT